MGTSKRCLLIAVVLFSSVGCDQVTKTIARRCLANSGPLSYLGNIFRFQYAENPGAFLSMGAGSPEHVRFWLFVVFIGFLLAGMVIYLMISASSPRQQTLALSLVAGGGISNLIDRIFNEGRVIDFMNVGIGTLRTGIFNVADLAITCGVVWIIAISIRGKRKHSNESSHS